MTERKKMCDKSKILNCPLCDDLDCELNVCGSCHDIETILLQIPSGICTCNAPVLNFKREDKNNI